MMVLLSVGLVLLMAGVLIVTICFSAALSIMPYISGALLSLAICTEVPFAKEIVPDHPFMNYCVILIIVEVIIAALMRIKWTGRATALCFSEIMVGIISMFILDAMEPDSIGYCVFITLVYLVGNLVFLTTNSSKYASEEKPVPAGIIISTLMYAIAAYFILAIPAELLWQKYIEQTFPSAVVGFMVAYWTLRIVICGGILVKGIIRAKKSVSVDQISERWDMDGREEASSKSV